MTTGVSCRGAMVLMSMRLASRLPPPTCRIFPGSNITAVDVPPVFVLEAVAIILMVPFPAGFTSYIWLLAMPKTRPFGATQFLG